MRAGIKRIGLLLRFNKFVDNLGAWKEDDKEMEGAHCCNVEAVGSSHIIGQPK